MSRPLIYDDQFTSLIHSNIKQKFLFCFSIKVQSTAFYQMCSLQNAIRICSLYDLIFGLTILYCSFSNISIIEMILIILSFFFCFISVNMSNNLSKKYSSYYYKWRLAITFIIPFIEFLDYSSHNKCYYSTMCTNIGFYVGISLGLTIIHLYLSKIAWSFNTRLLLNQELLIIHGKYLEQMLNNENHKYTGTKKYIPPPMKRKEMELLNFGMNGTVVDKDAFAPKK